MLHEYLDTRQAQTRSEPVTLSFGRKTNWRLTKAMGKAPDEALLEYRDSWSNY